MRTLIAIFVFAAALLAAPLRGIVHGGGVPLPGVSVTATVAGKSFTAVTADDGSFDFPDLPNGACTLRATMTGFVTATQTVTLPAPSADFELQIAPYHGPAVVATAPANTSGKIPPKASGFNRTELAGGGGGGTPASAPPPTSDLAAGGDPNRTATDSLAINGSIDNGAASAFAQSAAFGNFRRNGRGLYNGGFGLTLGNSALDARSFSISGLDSPKPSTSNLTGFLQVGGPLLIPHLLNANQAPNVFFAYEKVSNSQGVNTPGLVPTLAERAGDLTALGGPVLDPGQISPQAQALLQLYPLPNLAGDPHFNYQIPLVTNLHQDSMQVRVNKGVNAKNQLATNFGMRSTRSDNPNLFGFDDRTSVLGVNANITWVHSFTPRLYGTASINFSRQATLATPYFAGRANVSGAAGILGNSQSPLDWGPPSLAFSGGFSSLSDGLPLQDRNQTLALGYSGYWNRYDHNITFGGDFRRLEFNDLDQQDPRGAFTFNGAASGNDFEDFLLGTPDAAAVAFGNADKYFRDASYDLFLTDDWRATTSLTLNLGVRWEYTAPMTERYGRMVNLDLAPDFTAAAPVLASAPHGSITGATYPNSLLRPDKGGLEPRLGLAWHPLPASSLLLKAGYGIYYDSSVYLTIAQQMAEQSPLSQSLSVANTAATPLTLARAFLTPPLATPDVFGVDPNFRIGYAQTWNASLQRDLPASLVMTLSYLGTKGTRGAQRSYPNTYPLGSANPCPLCPVGFLYLQSNGNSTYESGKAQLQRRFHSGIAATVVYTYAHAIDDSALGGGANSSSSVVAQNWRDLDAERGRSSFDQRHLLTAQTQYSTGVGVKGGALLSGWKGAAYKGWTLTTQITAGSGLPLTPTTLEVVPGTGFTGIRPDLTGAPLYAPGAGAFLNPAAFTLPPAGAFGDAGRDSINGPSVFGLNASLQRSFQTTDRITTSVRFDATNALNHVAFPSWDTLVGSAQFGLPLAANPMRSLLATVRFSF